MVPWDTFKVVLFNIPTTSRMLFYAYSLWGGTFLGHHDTFPWYPVTFAGQGSMDSAGEYIHGTVLHTIGTVGDSHGTVIHFYGAM